MSVAPEPSSVRRALSAHAAIGLIAGALLYLVCLTGSLSVLRAELQRFEQRDAPEMTHIAPDAVQRGVEAVLASERGRKQATTHLYVHLPVEDLPRATVTTDSQAVHLTPDGRIAGPEEVAWSDFLLRLHYALTLPGLWGLILVGALGAAILMLALTGIVAHPRIFRDAFRLRARDTGGLALADWHNRLSVWTLPFSVAIALTGAVIGLGTLGAWAIATVFENGKVEAVYGPIFGEEGEPDPRPAAMPNVAAVLTTMARHYPDVTVTYATVHDPLTAGQEIQVTGEHARRLIFGETYRFDGAGRFVGTAGLSHGKTGQQAAASVYKLHFGSFGGLAVKLAYVALGTALTVICATGVSIWLGKRRRRGHDKPRLFKAWDAVVWGVPAALALSLLTRFVIGNSAPLAPVFWLASGLAVAAATSPVAPRVFRRSLQRILILLIVAVVASSCA